VLNLAAGMGGEVVKDLLSKVDIDTLNKELRRGLKETTTELAKAKIIKRLKVVESILKSNK
jgi:DNA-directed RNA polymerase subunit beta'